MVKYIILFHVKKSDFNQVYYLAVSQSSEMTNQTSTSNYNSTIDIDNQPSSFHNKNNYNDDGTMIYQTAIMMN